MNNFIILALAVLILIISLFSGFFTVLKMSEIDTKNSVIGATMLSISVCAIAFTIISSKW